MKITYDDDDKINIVVEFDISEYTEGIPIQDSYIIKELIRTNFKDSVNMFRHILSATLHMGVLFPVFNEMIINKFKEWNEEATNLISSLQDGTITEKEVLSKFIIEEKARCSDQNSPFNSFIENLLDNP